MIYLYPIDDKGCGSYRLIWIVQALEAKYPELQGQFKVVMPGDDTSGGVVARVSGSGRNQRVTDLKVPDDCKAVVLQRPSKLMMGQSIPFLRRAGVKVIIELDDDLEAISPRHFAWGQMRAPGNHPGLLKASCKHADLVTASTPALIERYAPHGRGVVLPNFIPRHLLQQVDMTEPRWGTPPLTVGWPGSMSTHPDDLDVMGGAIAQVCRGNVRFKILGGGSPKDARRILGTNVEVSGTIDFDKWLSTIKQELDVGVAPLELSSFNEAKSNLKPLELSAAGVPFVCSPSREYKALGAGLVVPTNKPREWVKALTSLVKDKSLREHEIGRNHEIVQKNILEDHVDLWRDAWLS